MGFLAARLPTFQVLDRNKTLEAVVGDAQINAFPPDVVQGIKCCAEQRPEPSSADEEQRDDCASRGDVARQRSPYPMGSMDGLAAERNWGTGFRFTSREVAMGLLRKPELSPLTLTVVNLQRGSKHTPPVDRPRKGRQDCYPVLQPESGMGYHVAANGTLWLDQ